MKQPEQGSINLCDLRPPHLIPGLRIEPGMSLALLLTALALPLLAPRQTSTPPAGLVSLATLRGTSRPLLIFAPRPDDPQLEIQLRRLHDRAAPMAERDVVPIAIPYASPSTTAAMLSNEEATVARRRFHIAPTDFAVILIGKDGGEKLRSSKPISIFHLCQTIDAMPMRQQEQREQQSRGGSAPGSPER